MDVREMPLLILKYLKDIFECWKKIPSPTYSSELSLELNAYCLIFMLIVDYAVIVEMKLLNLSLKYNKCFLMRGLQGYSDTYV